MIGERLADLIARHGDLGSGYPSDPVTRAWLTKHAATGAPWPDFVRTRWGTIQNLAAPLFQSADQRDAR
jgi:ribonuclease HII